MSGWLGWLTILCLSACILELLPLFVLWTILFVTVKIVDARLHPAFVLSSSRGRGSFVTRARVERRAIIASGRGRINGVFRWASECIVLEATFTTR